MTQLVVKKKGKNFILYENGMIRIDRVRQSYPHIDKAWKKEGDQGEPGFSMVGMLDKTTHADAIEFIKKHNIELIKESKLTIKADKRYMRDGDVGADDADDAAGENSYAGHWFISSRETNRPTARDSDGTKLDPVDDLAAIKEKFYGGAYCHMLIRPWIQNNKHGQRLNAGLVAVVFWKDGEPFGQGRVDDTDAWDDLDDGDAGGSDIDDEDDM